MYIVSGLLLIALSYFILDRTRSRNGKPVSFVAGRETVAGVVVIAIIVTFTTGMTLSILQFTG
ncbi:MAG: hypothetical protein ACK4QW_09340 [Alphaproteobacteria bacterium]